MKAEFMSMAKRLLSVYVLYVKLVLLIFLSLQLPRHAFAESSSLVVGMPFDGNWGFYQESSLACSNVARGTAHPSCHWVPGKGNWGTDLYANTGTDVTFTFESIPKGAKYKIITAGGSCGDSRRIMFYQNDTEIGVIYVTHMKNAVPVMNDPNDLTNNLHIGQIAGLSCNPGLKDKHHVHIEFLNSDINTKSCYIDKGIAGAFVNKGDPIGILGTNTMSEKFCMVPEPQPTPVDSSVDFHMTIAPDLQGSSGETLQQTDISTTLQDPQSSVHRLKVHITQLDISQFPKVVLYASIVDYENKLIENLTTQDISLSENGKLIKPIQLTTKETASKYSSLIVDISGSMAGAPLKDAKEATESYITDASADDQIEIIGFDSNVYAASAGFSNDKSKLIKSLDNLHEAGSTALYNGVQRSLENLSNVEGRKSSILLSDGADNSSTVKREDVLSLAKTANIPVYTIGIKSYENPEHIRLLQSLSANTGGRFYLLNNLNNLKSIFSGIDRQVNNEFLITYTSPHKGLRNTQKYIYLIVEKDGQKEWDTRTYTN